MTRVLMQFAERQHSMEHELQLKQPWPNQSRTPTRRVRSSSRGCDRRLIVVLVGARKWIDEVQRTDHEQISPPPIHNQVFVLFRVISWIALRRWFTPECLS